MAFRGRRFRPRRRFGARAVARKEPIWISSAYFVNIAPNNLDASLFQLIGPEDFTPDYTVETQRKDRCTLYRTVGNFNMIPVIPEFTNGRNLVVWKAALFVAGDKQVDDAYANDPGQFSIVDPPVFSTFCRDFSPIHIFWARQFEEGMSIVGGSTTTFAPNWHMPPSVSGQDNSWDVTVRRKLEGDDCLWLLVNNAFIQSPTEEVAGSIDVESRNLIMDQ